MIIACLICPHLNSKPHSMVALQPRAGRPGLVRACSRCACPMPRPTSAQSLAETTLCWAGRPQSPARPLWDARLLRRRPSMCTTAHNGPTRAQCASRMRAGKPVPSPSRLMHCSTLALVSIPCLCPKRCSLASAGRTIASCLSRTHTCCSCSVADLQAG